jgi:hypothetical protein
VVDVLNVHTGNRMMIPLAIASSGAGRDVGGGWDALTNVQCKPILNCHMELPLYDEYILIKMKESKNRTKSWHFCFRDSN